MVETISPVVYGGRTAGYWISWTLHALGAVIAAASIGALLAVAGAALRAPWGVAGLTFVIAVAVLVSLRDLFSLDIPLPQMRRQVPEWWRSFFSLPLTSFLYGLGLGVGFYTSLSVGTLVVVWAVSFASGEPGWGAALTAPFGLGRALSVAWADFERLETGRGQRTLDRINGLASLLIAATVAITYTG